MADIKTIIEQAYSAFNKRDIDGALALMTQDVSWPKASEGGKVVGKEEIRAYWTRQWGEFDPHVEPLAMTEEAEARPASGCTNSSRVLKGMFFRTARFSTYSP
jgi:ketosteroid isomerase-like protein